MTVLDERGRLAGGANVVDVAAAIVLALLIPAAIGAYILFRAPAPSLSSISPATLLESPGQRLEIDGANLRPFMRVTFGTTPAGSFLLGSTKYAIVDVPALKPGRYDVVLYDYAREVARLPNALTIAPVATDVEIEVDGVFTAATDGFASSLRPGATFADSGRTIATVVAAGGGPAPELRLRVGDETVAVPASRPQLPATLRVACRTVRGVDGVARCAIPSAGDQTIVAPDALLTLPAPGGPVVFQIIRARAPKLVQPTERN
jgi:hypothetical protein